MKKVFYILLAVLVFTFAMFLANREGAMELLFGEPDLGNVEFSDVLPSDKPNQALACPQGFCPNRVPDIVSPTYNLSASALQEKLRTALEEEEHLNHVNSTAVPLEDRYVQWSPFWRFPDTIQVQFIALTDTSSTIALLARAKVGETDFGANLKRIERWLDYLRPYEMS